MNYSNECTFNTIELLIKYLRGCQQRVQPNSMAANGTDRSAELPDLLFLFDKRQHHLLPIDSTEIFFQKIFKYKISPGQHRVVSSFGSVS